MSVNYIFGERIGVGGSSDVEITKAELDALIASGEVNPNISYYVKDWTQSGGGSGKGEAVDEINESLAKNNNYSTSEVIIGKWVNNKPLYRKTIVGTSANSDTYDSLSVGASIDYAYIENFGLKSSGVTWIPNNFTDGATSVYAFICSNAHTVSPNTVGINHVGTTARNQPFFVTICYTKTTD